MKKTRLQILTLVLGMSLIGTTIASDSDTFRTGTCGASSTDGDTCVSMGINMETGEILKVTDGGKDVWGENTEVIGQFATVESVNELVSQDLDSRITELSENYENVEVNVDNSVHNTTIDITEEQLVDLKGKDGAVGAKGDKGEDGITTVVNEYDREQVDQDFATDTDVSNTNQRVTDTQAVLAATQQTLYQEGLLRAKSDAIVARNAQKKLDKAIENQSKIDNAQDVNITNNTNRITKAEQELYSTTERSKRNESDIKFLKQDITRLDGMVAANMAASSIVVPSDFNGNLSLGVGVGHYNGQSGLAVGVLHDGGGYALKATVSGTDADDWSNLAYGASINFAF